MFFALSLPRVDVRMLLIATYSRCPSNGNVDRPLALAIQFSLFPWDKSLGCCLATYDSALRLSL